MVTQLFSTAEDNQTSITIRMYRGKAELVADAHELGEYEIREIPEAPERPEIALTIWAREGKIEIVAVDASTNKALPIMQ